MQAISDAKDHLLDEAEKKRYDAEIDAEILAKRRAQIKQIVRTYDSYLVLVPKVQRWSESNIG